MGSRITLNADIVTATIDKNIYGHFAEHLGRCIYEGIWVGEDSAIPNVKGLRKDVLEALKKMKIPVLRWPGGCFADEYHWKDGIGPRNQRKRMVNTHWGGVVEDNQFGTHEFMLLCEQLGCEPYVNGNVGSGSVQEMSEWVEYISFEGDSPLTRERAANGRPKAWPIKYFGVGNESWGCGGNMSPEFYANLFRQYQTYVRNYGDNKIVRIACGANTDDYNWTEVLMRDAARFMDGLTVHYYSWFSHDGTWSNKVKATGFDKKEWFIMLQKALGLDEILTRHSTIMDKYDPAKRVALIVDEWGSWYKVEEGTNPGFLYQQNTIRDALIAAVSFHIFHKHADRVRMANIAQTVNVLQSVLLTDGAKMVATPTYHVFEMFAVHQDAQALAIEVASEIWEMDGKSIPRVSASASKNGKGKIHVSLANLDPESPATVEIDLRGLGAGAAKAGSGTKQVSVLGRALTAAKIDDHNDFGHPETVAPKDFKDFKVQDGTLSATLPARSVVVLSIE